MSNKYKRVKSRHFGCFFVFVYLKKNLQKRSRVCSQTWGPNLFQVFSRLAGDTKALCVSLLDCNNTNEEDEPEVSLLPLALLKLRWCHRLIVLGFDGRNSCRVSCQATITNFHRGLLRGRDVQLTFRSIKVTNSGVWLRQQESYSS